MRNLVSLLVVGIVASSACNEMSPPVAASETTSALCMGTPCNTGGTCGGGLECQGGCCVQSCRSCSLGCNQNEQCDPPTSCCVPLQPSQSCYNSGGNSCSSGEPCGAPIGQSGWCAQNCYSAQQGDECCFTSGCRSQFTNTYQACAYNGSNYVCVGPTLCIGAFADCNGNLNDGCETPIDQTSSCGDCPDNPAAVCNPATHHAYGGTCVQSSPGEYGCQYFSCLSGYADCNANAFDGCETDLNTVGNCGSCGHNCAAGGTPAGGTWTCQSQSCVLTCPGKSVCGNTCVDTTNDVNNCGGCGVQCDTIRSMGAQCFGSTCAYFGCVDGWQNCTHVGADSDGCEQNIASITSCGDCPSDYTGHCQNYNYVTPQCARLGPNYYQCTGTTCLPNYYDCSPGYGCETHCGAFLPSGAHFSCTPTPCTITCGTGLSLCYSSCVNYTNDPLNCGGCNANCNFANSAGFTGTCSAGVCTSTCAAGHLDCLKTGADLDGCETPYSVSNCGSCGHACTAAGGATACSSTGHCAPACDATHGDCDGNPDNGCEQPSDVLHCGGAACGACDTTHSTPTGCVSNICQYTCPSGYTNCNKTGADLNGCETAEDSAHCTAACISCPTPAHTTGGACKADACDYVGCLPGYADCNGNHADGCEVQIAADAKNCGACGTVCPNTPGGTPSCVAGACSATCDLDASTSLKLCGDKDAGTVMCNECCVDSDCTATPDKCHSGSCLDGVCAYPAKSCVIVDCFSTPSCNTANGNCESTPLTGGTTCGGKNCYANNATGTCASGQCVDGSGNPLQQITCPGTGPCKLGVCDNTGACAVSDAVNGNDCTPDDKCQIGGTCAGGVCNGTAKVCTTTATCRTSVCNSASGDCEDQIANAGAPCSTSQACIQNEACDATGACVGTELPGGTPCALADCTGGATCQTGICTCDTSPIDQAQPEMTVTDMLTSGTDMTKASGHSKHGCAVGGNGSGDFGLSVCALGVLLMARRRRGGARG